jgi:hypothetical protein
MKRLFVVKLKKESTGNWPHEDALYPISYGVIKSHATDLRPSFSLFNPNQLFVN